MLSDNTTIASIITAGPWLIGGLALCLTGGQFTGKDRPISLIDFATGGYLAYVATALSTVFISRIGSVSEVYPLIILFLLVTITAITFCTVKPANRLAYSKPLASRGNIYPRTLSALLISITVFGLIISLPQPMSAWDTLQLWAPEATEFIQAFSQNSVYIYENRHPPAIPLILSFPHWVAGIENNQASPASITWWTIWIGHGLIIFGACALCGVRTIFCILLTAAAITIPIIENHALLPGYNELFVGTALAATVAYGVEWLRSGYVFSLILALIVSTSAIALKNTSPFYVALPFIGLATAKVITLRSLNLASLLFFILGLIAGIYLLREGFVFKIFNNTVGYNGGNIIFLGGRELRLTDTSFAVIFENTQHAYFLNQTFSVCIVFLVLSIFWALKDWQTLIRSEAFVFVLMTILVGCAGLIASQFTEYGLRFAVPDRDTGNSRFSAPIVMIFPLLAALLAKHAESTPGARQPEIHHDDHYALPPIRLLPKKAALEQSN